ncbi:MAG: hypothetical protein KAI14_00950 [Dehalococcoidales bacterium]|nr:hypothetical protein [Dehalococcoidales bacterium]
METIAGSGQPMAENEVGRGGSGLGSRWLLFAVRLLCGGRGGVAGRVDVNPFRRKRREALMNLAAVFGYI